MKKSLSVLLLAFAVTGVQALALPLPQQATPADAQQKKVIQDQAEGAAYMAAINAPDPAQKAQQMESFLQTYPNSVAKEDGYEFLVKTYQQLGNVAKVKSSAAACLQANPNNITSLVFLTVLNAQDNGPDAAASLQAAGQYGARCVKALETAAKPEGVADAQWEATKTQFRTLCNTYLGYAALQGKDYPTAQTALKAVVAGNPTDNQSIYLLAISYLSPKPIVVDGLFWIAKAAGNDPKFMSYAQNRYQRYHGGADGFDDLMAAAKANPTIPAGFTVAPAPSPADQANDMLKKGAPETLSFAEWQFILTSGNKDAGDKTWTAIKGKPTRLIASVVEVDAARTTLKLAGSQDDIEAKKADIIITIKTAIPATRLPKPGTQLTIQGTPSEYTANGDDFVLTFIDGEVLSGLPEAPRKPAAGHTAPRKP